MKKKTAKSYSRGERVVKFIERYCLIPEGRRVRKPVKLEPFQKKFIIDVYDNPHGTSVGILSIARKNAKTALIAFILLAHICGPEAVHNSRIVSGALSKEQAAEVYNYASKCVQLSPELSSVCTLIPSLKKIIGLARNVEYQALSADAKNNHGKSPVVAIIDEAGQVEGQTSDFIDSITTAQGAYDDPLLFYMSTQAAKDSDFFSILIDDALEKKPKSTVCHLYSADSNCDLMDKAQWKKANPGLGSILSLKTFTKSAERAQRMPSFEATFRRLHLNQRIEVRTPFISPTVWKQNGAAPLGELRGAKVYGGLDLSSTSDLTALVLVSQHGKAFDVRPAFWLPDEGLEAKSRNDRVPYDAWRKQGHLLTTPGRSIEYEHIAEYLRGVFDQCDVQAIGFDKQYMNFLRPWLEKVGFTEEEIEKFKEVRQTTTVMGPMLRELESLLLQNKIRHGGHPVLTMCADNAIVYQDSTGMRKFDKKKSTARIDGMVALALAVGMLPTQTEDYESADYKLVFG